MKVIANFANNYWEEQSRYFNFEEFEDRANDCYLFIGGWPDQSIFQDMDMPKIFFSTEEQVWDRDGTDQFVPYVDKILTLIDPKYTGRAKRQPVFIPISTALIPPPTEKIYDVIYTGFARMPHVDDILRVIPSFNYCLVSFNDQGGLATHQNVLFREKLVLISQSKCCVVQNLLGNNTPQLKSRAFEAAFSKSLMLVLKDSFNVIEDWFVPGEHFLYYSTPQELHDLIDLCSTNYEQFVPLVNSAYDKAINNYTSEKFIERYIGFKS